jgi:hypothetical protein
MRAQYSADFSRFGCDSGHARDASAQVTRCSSLRVR